MVTSRLILSRHIRILSLLLLTMSAAALVLAVPVDVTVPPTNTMPARAIDTGIAPTPAIGAAAARTTDVTVADPVQPYAGVYRRRVDYTGEKLGYEKPSYDDFYTNAVSGTGAGVDVDASTPPTPNVRYTKYPASVHVPLGYNRYKNGYYGYYPYRRAADDDGDDDQAGTPGTDSYYKAERPGYLKEGYLNVYNGRTAEDDDVDEDDSVDNRFRHHGHHHRHPHPHTPRHPHSHPHTPRISGSAPASVGLETAPTPMAATVTAAEAAAATPTPQVATANVDAASGLQGVSDQAQAQAEPRATANGAETQYIPLVSGLLDNIPIVGPLVSGLLGGGGGGGIFGILGGGGGGLVNSVLGGVTSTGLGGLVNGAARAATAATNGALDAATAATNGALDAATAATNGVLGGLGI